MPPSPTTYDCGHERRPGTTVCLQCRQEAISWSARRQRRILGFGAVIVALGALLAAGTILRRDASGDAEAETVQGSSEARPVEGGLSAAETTPGPVASAAVAPLVPRISQGRTELGDGVYAIRTGDTVIVNFDTPGTRTRRRDKFEATLRRTLRKVYGEPADTVLAAQPEGLLRGRDLLSDVTSTGLRLPLPDGRGTLAVWPRTRPGQDGPLVVSYIAVPGR